MKKYLITGCAGFIGYYLTEKIISEGHSVIGVDNINNYYDIKLKLSRLESLQKHKNFKFEKIDISDSFSLTKIFEENKFDYIVNLAAQAGVRYSVTNPDEYIKSNIIGFYNIIELIRKYPVKHFIYASSSSVYGANTKVPFEETDNVDKPVSLYAATKKTNELLSYTYSHLYGIPSTGLRFFTVYGPKGRPDMAYFNFTTRYFEGLPIKIYNNGDFMQDMYRDFTYIDDIIEGIIKVISKPPIEEIPPYRILNIGNNKPVKLMEFITTLENELSISFNKKIVFEKIYEGIKAGDVYKTYASIDKLKKLTGFEPKTSINEGLKLFSNWYKGYRKDEK